MRSAKGAPLSGAFFSGGSRFENRFMTKEFVYLPSSPAGACCKSLSSRETSAVRCTVALGPSSCFRTGS